MRIIDCVQGTHEWRAARAGKITASHAADIMASIKSGEAASRRNYRARLVCETLTGEPVEEDFQSGPMLWGVEHEAEARELYSSLTLQTVTQVGLVLHPTNDRIAASPDGLVGDKGLLEIKCPLPATHLNYRMVGVVPSEYRYQMWAQMLCCERDWCDFMSYDPRFPPEHQYFICRFHRDNKEIILLEASCKQFLAELDATLAQLPKCPTIKL